MAVLPTIAADTNIIDLMAVLPMCAWLACGCTSGDADVAVAASSPMPVVVCSGLFIVVWANSSWSTVDVCMFDEALVHWSQLISFFCIKILWFDGYRIKEGVTFWCNGVEQARTASTNDA